MVNVVGLTALQAIRKVPEFKEAVIAGGFVRDDILGGSFADIDIYIPIDSFANLTNAIRKVANDKIEQREVIIDLQKGRYIFVDTREELTPEQSRQIKFINKTENKVKVTKTYFIPTQMSLNFNGFTDFKRVDEFQYAGKGYLGHYNCKFMKDIDVDIIGVLPPRQLEDAQGNKITENFGEHVISNFSYGIDRAFFDGVDIVTSKEFENDLRHQTSTLLLLNDISSLPKHMKKYLKLKEKYNNFRWRCDLIELKSKEKEENNKKSKSQYLGTGGTWTNTTTTINEFVQAARGLEPRLEVIGRFVDEEPDAVAAFNPDVIQAEVDRRLQERGLDDNF